MIVDDIDIGASQGYATAAHPKGGLIAPGSGTRIEIEGSFAGWLEVLP
jgi:hypothetical protein